MTWLADEARILADRLAAMSRELDSFAKAMEAKASLPLVVAPEVEYVTIQLFAQLSGYSEKATRRKIERGDWLEGREFARAPDGRVLMSMKGYASWAASNQNKGPNRPRKPRIQTATPQARPGE